MCTVKPDDGVGEGSVGTMAGGTNVPPAAVERLNGDRPSKGGPAKGKTTKKSKGKSAKKNGAVEDRFGPPFNGGKEREDPGAAIVIAPDDGGGRPPQERVEEEGLVADRREGRGEPTRVETDPTPTAEGSDPTTSQVAGREAGVATEPDSAPSTTRPWTHSNRVLVGAGVLVAALAVALILSLLALGNQDAQVSSRTSALAAARTYAVQLASYNYRDLKVGFATVAADSTSSFRRSFTESSDALKTTLTRYKATADASAVSAGLVSSDPSRAVALVFLTQRIANSTQPKPTTDRSQVEITLVRSGGRWLIDQVTLL
jgi:Mce-associated membrane protein